MKKCTASSENQIDLFRPQHLANLFFLFLILAQLVSGHLRVAPVVEDANLMHALDSAGGRAPLFGFVFAVEIFDSVVCEGNSRIAALLRAPVNQAVFADVEIARAGTTAPLIRFALGDAVLKPVKARVILVAELFDGMKGLLLVFRQRLQRAVF